MKIALKIRDLSESHYFISTWPEEPGKVLKSLIQDFLGSGNYSLPQFISFLSGRCEGFSESPSPADYPLYEIIFECSQTPGITILRKQDSGYDLGFTETFRPNSALTDLVWKVLQIYWSSPADLYTPAEKVNYIVTQLQK